MPARNMVYMIHVKVYLWSSLSSSVPHHIVNL